MLDIIMVLMILVMAIMVIIITPQVVIHYRMFPHHRPPLGIHHLMLIIKTMVTPVLSNLVELIMLPRHSRSDIKTIPQGGANHLPVRITLSMAVITLSMAVITASMAVIIT